MSKSVVIDDLDEAVSLLFPLGRDVVRPAAAAIREAVLLFAARHGWDVVSHKAFARWLQPQVDPDYVWLVLDPLIDCTKLGAMALRLRVSRRLQGSQWVISDALPPEVR